MLEVLGIPFYPNNIQLAVQDVLQACNPSYLPKNYCISASGAHGLVEAHKDPAFKKILCSFYLNLPDGMPIVWIGKLKGAKNIQRCYGPDFTKELLKASANLPINHFFCGGKEGVADALKLATLKKFNNPNVVGTYCPPFREMTDDEIQALAHTINQSKVNIVWIGLGCPKQEKFAYRLAQYTKTNFIIAVGAAFDFHTDNLKQAPPWVQQIGMEWFFRLLMEPKRLFKRYVEIVPMFIWLNIKEVVHFYFGKKTL